MKIYIDFDGTLFDSTTQYKRFVNVFKKYNIKEEYIKQEMKCSYQKHRSFDILAKKIVKEHNLNKNIFKELDITYSEDLIFKDAIPFLEKYYKKYDLILLTIGNIPYQQKKINSSKINKYFKDIIITDKDKSKLNINYNEGLFIDNNPNELKKFHNSKAAYLIRIKRNTDKYSKLDLDINNIPEFINFEELTKSKYIDKIGEKNYE